MKLPKTIKGRLRLFITIAEEGNSPLIGSDKLTKEEELLIGGLIADIQNNLGEMAELLSKYDLSYGA